MDFSDSQSILCSISRLSSLVNDSQHCSMMTSSHGTFSRYWPFVRGIHRSLVNSLHKDQWRRALMFTLISAWINGWVNNREAGDLRRNRGHYDVRVIRKCYISGWAILGALDSIMHRGGQSFNTGNTSFRMPIFTPVDKRYITMKEVIKEETQITFLTILQNDGEFMEWLASVSFCTEM